MKLPDMYKSDEHGRYAVRAEWVDAFSDRFSSWHVCQARQYEDGPIRIHRGPMMMAEDAPEEIKALLSIFMIADNRLKSHQR